MTQSPLATQLRTQRALMSARHSLARLKLNEIRWQKTQRRVAARTPFDYPRLDWFVIAMHMTPEPRRVAA